MLWNNLPYEEALAIYELKLKEILKINDEDSIIRTTASDTKLNDLIDGLSTANSVKEIRIVASNLKGESD